LTVPAADTAELTAVVADALADAGRSIDELTAAEAIELADTLRAIVAALPAPTTRDVRLTAALNAAVGIVERHDGTASVVDAGRDHGLGINLRSRRPCKHRA